jgi:hypothetical protein
MISMMKTQKHKTTKSKTTFKKRNNSSQKGYTGKPFLKYSRLPLLERKYCSCIMAVRHRKYKTKDKDMNPYGICIHNVYLKRGKTKNRNLDCGINYDLDNFKIEYLKAYAKERGIPLTYVNATGKRVYYSKTSLVNKLRKSMIEAKKNKN